MRNAIGSLLTAALAISLVALMTPVPASARHFYSVDIDADQLVQIDSQTGAVTPIGSLGEPVESEADMTILGGSLFAIVWEDTWVNSRLVEIDTVTGEIISSVPTTMPDGTNGFGESLFVYGGQLHMSVDPGHDSFSELVAAIAPDGLLTVVADYSDTDNRDCDGLETHPVTGLVYNLDHDGTAGGYADLFLVTISPPSQTLICHYPQPGLRVNDVVILGSTMYGIGRDPARLLTFDLRTGVVVRSLSLDTTHELRGIAAPAQCGMDLDDDGYIDLSDLAILLPNYGRGEMGHADGDFTGDGLVGCDDLASLLAVYGMRCP